jgi:hypothetical protein
MLAVSSLVNTYCQHSPHCAQEAEVQAIVNYLLDSVINQCQQVDDSNLKQVSEQLVLIIASDSSQV